MRHIVTQYQGITSGWVPVRGSLRPLAKHEAERLAAIMQRVDPLHRYKAQGLAPELPSFL